MPVALLDQTLAEQTQDDKLLSQIGTALADSKARPTALPNEYAVIP